LTAQLTLDGKPLAGNPYVGTVAADSSDHVLAARAPGFTSQTRGINLSQDLEVVLNLRAEEVARPPQAARGSGPSRAAPQPARETPAAAAPAHPKGDCDPPFFVDDRGVKKFKPGCL
jgi:hypothetical protein